MNSTPQTNLPETSASAEGGDMMMGGNVAMTGQLDPLVVPQMTQTPAVATASQEIAGSDMATIPTVLETMGGLEPTGLLLTNYAANVVALCNKDIYVRRYNITSETAAETILDEIDFNPWDPNLVSAPIAIYGGAHQIFNGSIDITINSYSAATIVGSVILSYVPPLLQAGFVPTLQNLTTVPHTILNLKVGGSSKITVTGGNLKDCAVSRAEIEAGSSLYGKIYIAAFTDIVNAYGVQVSIPIVRFASLGKDSYFSHPSYLIGEGGGTVVNPGPTPPVVSNLILDSSVIYNPSGITSSLAYYSPNVTNGTVKLIPTGTSRTAIEPPFGSIGPNTGDVGSIEIPRFFWGSNIWGNTYDGIKNSVNNRDILQSYFVQGDGSGGTNFVGVAVSASGVIPNNSTPAFVYNGLTINAFSGNVYELQEKLGIGSVPRLADAILPNASALAVTLELLNVQDKGGNIDTDGNTVLTYFISTSGVGEVTRLENSDNPIIPALPTDEVTYQLLEETNTSFNLEFLGAPVLANTPPSVSAPNGYVALYFDNDSFFIPAVLPTAGSTRSMPWPRSHNRYMTQVEAFFQLNPSIRSYSYSMTLVTGQSLGDILVNRVGVFMYDSSASSFNYAVLPNAGTIVYQNYQSYATDYPAIQEYASDQFISRVVSSTRNYAFKRPFLAPEIKFSEKDESFMFKRVLELEKKLQQVTTRTVESQTDIPEMFAAQLATNAVGGMAGVFNSKAERAHETEMQKRELHYWAGGQLLDYKKAMRLGNLRADTEMNKARIQRDVAMAQFGYNANSTMRGAGNSFNTNSNTSDRGTNTGPTNRDASTQAGRVNMHPRTLNTSATQSSGAQSAPRAGTNMSSPSTSKQPPSGGVATPYAQVHVDNPSAGASSMA